LIIEALKRVAKKDAVHLISEPIHAGASAVGGTSADNIAEKVKYGNAARTRRRSLAAE